MILFNKVSLWREEKSTNNRHDFRTPPIFCAHNIEAYKEWRTMRNWNVANDVDSNSIHTKTSERKTRTAFCVRSERWPWPVANMRICLSHFEAEKQRRVSRKKSKMRETDWINERTSEQENKIKVANKVSRFKWTSSAWEWNRERTQIDLNFFRFFGVMHVCVYRNVTRTFNIWVVDRLTFPPSHFFLSLLLLLLLLWFHTSAALFRFSRCHQIIVIGFVPAA